MMTRRFARQVAIECDQLIEQMVSGSRDGAQLWTLTARTLARAATTLHTLAAPSPAGAPEPPEPETGARLKFEVTGGNLTQLRARADETIGGFADGRQYRFDVAAYPAVSTTAGRVMEWRADITATLYPQET